MRVFDFAAFSPSGEKKQGTVRAGSLSEAKRKVQGRGFYIASIQVQDASDSYGQNSSAIFKGLKELFFIKKKTNI